MRQAVPDGFLKSVREEAHAGPGIEEGSLGIIGAAEAESHPPRAGFLERADDIQRVHGVEIVQLRDFPADEPCQLERGAIDAPLPSPAQLN